MNLTNVFSSMMVMTSETGETSNKAAARGKRFFPKDEDAEITCE
jgi:hypothetical protein